MIACAFLAFIIERVAYKPLRDAPRISALITAIGVSFFLEYFGALPFVFTPNFVTYERPFPVVNWVIQRHRAFNPWHQDRRRRMAASSSRISHW